MNVQYAEEMKANPHGYWDLEATIEGITSSIFLLEFTDTDGSSWDYPYYIETGILARDFIEENYKKMFQFSFMGAIQSIIMYPDIGIPPEDILSLYDDPSVTTWHAMHTHLPESYLIKYASFPWDIRMLRRGANDGYTERSPLSKDVLCILEHAREELLLQDDNPIIGYSLHDYKPIYLDRTKGEPLYTEYIHTSSPIEERKYSTFAEICRHNSSEDIESSLSDDLSLSYHDEFPISH